MSTQTNPKTVIELLGAKGQRWIKNKWRTTKRVKGENVECFCLQTAIEEVYGNNTPKGNKAIDRTTKIVQAYSGRTDTGIPGFNDMRKTTFEDVSRVIRLARI